MTNDDFIKSALEKCKDDGVTLVENEKTDYISFDKIKSRKTSKKLPDELDDWTTADFVRFARTLYNKRFNKSWVLNFTGSCNQFIQVRDAVVESLGFCDNIVIYHYLKFFFDGLIDKYMRADGEFYFEQMKRTYSLQMFLENFNYSDVVKNIDRNKIEVKDAKPSETSEKKMNDMFLLSKDRFLVEYGFVLLSNWCIIHEEKSLDDTMIIIHKASNNLIKRKLLNKALTVTESLSPYPDWFPCQDLLNVYDSLKIKFPPIIKFNNNIDKYNFFRRNCS